MQGSTNGFARVWIGPGAEEPAVERTQSARGVLGLPCFHLDTNKGRIPLILNRRTGDRRGRGLKPGGMTAPGCRTLRAPSGMRETICRFPLAKAPRPLYLPATHCVAGDRARLVHS